MPDGRRIHFTFEPGKRTIERFAKNLMKVIGQTPFDDAEVIVSVGGDGSLLHAFRRAHDGQKVFGVVPPGSNSRGFWANRGITGPEKLMAALDAAKGYKIRPLRADLYRTDGSKTCLKAFNDVVPSENSGQAMLVELKIEGKNSTIGPLRIMGDGLIFATAFGSTAMNRTYGGPAIDIRNSGITLSGQGIYEPNGGFGPIVADDNTRFEVKFLSPGKRPVRLQYDGLMLTSDAAIPFDRVIVQKDKRHAIELLLTDDPSTRAFAVMLKP